MAGVDGMLIQQTCGSRKPQRVAWSSECFAYKCSLVLGQSIVTNMWTSYGSALNSYLDFIHLHNFDPEPTTNILSLFTTYMSKHIKPSSVASYLSGICQQLEPFFPDIRKNWNSPLVCWTLPGCKHLYGSPIIWKQALTLDNLQHVVSHYEKSLLTLSSMRIFVANSSIHIWLFLTPTSPTPTADVHPIHWDHMGEVWWPPFSINTPHQVLCFNKTQWVDRPQHSFASWSKEMDPASLSNNISWQLLILSTRTQGQQILRG